VNILDEQKAAIKIFKSILIEHEN